MPTLQEQIDFVLGPQVPVTGSWLDQTLISKARQHGEACPVDPPTGENELNAFTLLHYYDLPLSLYIAHRRTGDPSFLALARKAADSWWKHPSWIGEGAIRLWPDSAAPPPRHAGIGGLILRALDGRPEMWDWIVGYTNAHLNIWCKLRINNSQLWYGPREVAFTMQFAAWVAMTLPDSYPNASQIKAQLVADLENLTINYTGRLQYPDGSWRDSSEWVDSDGGTMVNSMQPFIVGLLICALVDVYQVVTSTAAKESAKNQILKACRHLYADGPYAKDLIEQKSGKRVRGFHYFYHGGTTVNPTKYAKGDMKDPWTDVEGWWLSAARQAISTILPAFGYAFLLSGDQFYKDAASEMYDSAYGGGDGFRAFLTDTAKNYNQHARRVGSLAAWLGGQVAPPPAPTPTPTPTPTPDPVPSPSVPRAVLTSPAIGAKVSDTITLTATAEDAAGIANVYFVVDDVVIGGDSTLPYTFNLDTRRLSDGNHVAYVRAWNSLGKAGDSAKVTFVVANVPVPDPTPIPDPAPPPPQPVPCSMTVTPAELTLPVNGMGTVTVMLEHMTAPTEVTAIGSSGQVTVNPGLRKVSGTSASIEFQIGVKRKGGTVTFKSGCGSKVVVVKVG